MDAPISGLTEAEKFVQGLRVLVSDVHDLLSEVVGDEYFETRLVLPEHFSQRLGTALHRLRQIRIEGGALNYLMRDLAFPFPAHVITDFIEAVESRDFRSMKQASLRLDDEVASFSRVFSLTTSDSSGGRTPWVFAGPDQATLKALYRDALDKLTSWTHTLRRFSPADPLLGSFRESVAASLQLIADQLTVGGHDTIAELDGLRRRWDATEDDLHEFDGHAVDPQFELAPIDYDYDCRDPAVGPESLPALIRWLELCLDRLGPDESPVTARELARHVREDLGEKVVRTALTNKELPDRNHIVREGRKGAPSLFVYHKAIEILKDQKSGELAGVEWPERKRHLKNR